MNKIILYFCITFFSFGIGFISPYFTNLFFIPLYYMFLREEKIVLFTFVLFFAGLMDIGEGIFPINFILILFFFSVFAFQKFIPYLQERIYFQLGFLILTISFFISKNFVLNYFYSLGFSWEIILNFICIIICFLLTELLLLYLIKNREKKIRARR